MARSLSTALLTIGALVSLASCGRQSGTPDVVLNVGESFALLKPALAASGEDKGTPYKLVWSKFSDGPKVAAALTGGSVDIGAMSDTPALFAQASGTPLKVVSVVLRDDPKASLQALVVRPDSAIRSVRDLANKSVSFVSGTGSYYLVFKALEQAGLPLTAIRQVPLPYGAGLAALEQGSIDATVIVDPVLPAALKDGKVRVLVPGGEPIVREMNLILASTQSLGNKQKDAAIRDFLQRLTRAEKWLAGHPKEAIALAAKSYNVKEDVATVIAARGPSHVAPITPEITQIYGDRAATFFKAGALKKPFSTKDAFDTRYNDIGQGNGSAPQGVSNSAQHP